MTFSIGTLVTVLVLAAAGVAQASELSDPPVAMSTKSRADVAAEARRAPATNQLYDGREFDAPTQTLATRSREAVRAEARRSVTAAPSPLYIGG